jgi:hypothetical protein
MSAALIGHTGFVGGNLVRQHAFSDLYNSKNIAEIRGRAFDTLVFSGAQAKKWWANQNPEADREGIEAALANLRDVRAAVVVLVSTVDVLPARPGLTEAWDGDDDPGHAYGRNRRFLERALSEMFPRVCVVRLPALFGPGLKKNVIYDLMNDNQLDKIHPASSFQYYDLSRLWQDVGLALARELSFIHLFPEPLETARIVERFFPDRSIGADPVPEAHYDFKTRHDALFGRSDGYVASAEQVLTQMGAFIEAAPREGGR